MRSPTNQLRPLRTKDAVVPAVLRVVTPFLAAVLTVGCSDRQDPPHVVLYVSADAHLARSVAAAFEAETGVRVDLVGDTELKKTTGLVERLRGERDHPQADVFWSSEIFMTIALADEGVLAPHVSEVAAGWPAEWRDAEGRWFAFAARARVIAFAPERLAPEHVPETWTDLDHPRLRGRIAMADPRFGTTGGHLGAMKAFWDRAAGPAYYQAFLIGLRDNEIRLLPGGNAGVVQAIIDGDVDVGLTDTDDVWAAHARGHRLGIVFADHSHEDEAGNGTLLIPNSVGRVAGGPHPREAALLVDFLLSEQVERRLAESVSRNVPLRPGLAEAYPDLAVNDPLHVDYRRAARHRAAAVDLAMRILTGATDDGGPAARTSDAP